MVRSNIHAVADALIRARRENTVADAMPLAEALTDAADAYAVQDLVARELGWFEAGPAQHWKSGGPSRQAALTHAALPPAGVWNSPADSGAWPFRLRAIEAEIALRLATNVDAGIAQTLQANDAHPLVDAMTVSIEIVDSRWREADTAPALCKLADVQSHGALVLGAWVPFALRDWSAQVCRVQIGTQSAIERQGTHSLADPVWLLPAWLRHATRDGHHVPAGTVVTTGTWVGMLPAQAGDRVTAEFAGIGRASVQL